MDRMIAHDLWRRPGLEHAPRNAKRVAEVLKEAGIGATSPAEHAFMEKIVAANLSLIEGYNRLEDPYWGQDS